VVVGGLGGGGVIITGQQGSADERSAPWGLRATAVVVAAMTMGVGIVVAPGGGPSAAAQDATPAQTGDPDPVLFNDPLLEFQWYLDRIRARQAWSLTPGLSSVTIAIVDTGVDAAHQDLDGAFWINDDGANGYDYVRQTSSTYVDADRDWHGTAVAGIAGARADDGYGMAGVAPGVSLLVARIYESESTSEPPRIVGGVGSAADAIRAVANAGADVILLTWGINEPNDDLLAAISDVEVPVVAAAGNDGVDLSSSSQQRFPAAYQLPNLVTVAASDRNGALVDSDRPSNFGESVVDLAAPGEAIVSLTAGGQHQLFDGTSFAAPQGAGALARGRSRAPAATTG
jgi:thermitase